MNVLHLGFFCGFPVTHIVKYLLVRVQSSTGFIVIFEVVLLRASSPQLPLTSRFSVSLWGNNLKY